MVKTEIKSREKLRPDDIAKPSTAPSVFGHGVPSIPFLCLRWLVQSFCRWQPGALTHPILTDVPVAVVAASPTSCISCHRIPHSWKGEAEPSPTPPPPPRQWLSPGDSHPPPVAFIGNPEAQPHRSRVSSHLSSALTGDRASLTRSGDTTAASGPPLLSL